MNMKKETTFWSFMRSREQLVCLAVLTALFAAVAVLMRIHYPMPFVFPDTYTYLSTASGDYFDIYRPNGYPHWLQFLHGISPTLGFLFAVNFVLYALSSLLLLFSAKYVLGIRNRWLFWAMALCAVLSPRLVFCTNFMMSDGLFAVLASVLLTACLWMVHGRSWLWAAVSLATMWFMCSLRYSGLFFVPALVVAFFASFSRSRLKVAPWLAAVLPLLLAVVFYSTTKKEYTKNTHVEVFSGFGGWQKLNNAMVLMPEAKELSPLDLKNNVRGLHKFMQSMPDSLFDSRYTMQTDYMWSTTLPCKQYVYYMCQTTGSPYGHQWVASSKVFGDYANQLVAKYPFRYLTRFYLPSLWSNTRFHNFREETITVEDKGLFGKWYGTDFETYDHECHFFGAVDKVRPVAQTIYWVCAALAMVWFFVTMRRRNFADRAWLGLFVMLLSFIIFIGGQSAGSPCTTWRYSLPFYQGSIVFMFACLERLLFRPKGGMR